MPPANLRLHPQIIDCVRFGLLGISSVVLAGCPRGIDESYLRELAALNEGVDAGGGDSGNTRDGATQSQGPQDASQTSEPPPDASQREDAGGEPDDGGSPDAESDVDGSEPTSVCGDSVVTPGEETCDDGDDAEGDGCDGNCQQESGWACPPAGGECAQVDADCPSELAPNEQIEDNERLCSPNGRYRFGLDEAGCPSFYAGLVEQWTVDADDCGAVRIKMQGDGNLVARDGDGDSTWSSSTAGEDGARLFIEDEGQAVIRREATVVWQIGPSGSDDPQ